MAAIVIDLRDDRAPDDFDGWFRAHRDALELYCVRFLQDTAAAADVAQEALFRAWSHRDRFTEPGQVRPWLWRVAHNLCIDAIRSRRRVVPSDSLPDRPQVDGAVDPGRRLELEDDQRSVRAALEELSPRHRELLVRREVDGAAYEDLAAEMGVSVEGARAVLFRARRCLQHQLDSMSSVA
jgi:RNA polymerase sigma-70 factor (ECF subfamily)